VLAACNGGGATAMSGVSSAAPTTAVSSAATSSVRALAAPTSNSASATATGSGNTAAGARATPTSAVIRTGAFGKAQVVLEWLTYFQAADLDRLQNSFLPMYEQAHPGVSIEVLLDTGAIVEAEQKFKTLTAAGTPPDLFASARSAAGYARQELVADLSSAAAKDKFDTAKYNQSLFDYQALYQGKLMALPVAANSPGPAMVYNRDHFQKAGLPIPPAT